MFLVRLSTLGPGSEVGLVYVLAANVGSPLVCSLKEIDFAIEYGSLTYFALD